MSSRTPSSPAPESVEIDDVVQGIVRLPRPLMERVTLLRKLYQATERLDNGQCVIEGPFREELHALFSERHRALQERGARLQRLSTRSEREALLLDRQEPTHQEEEELGRIVAETRLSFDDLDKKLATFGKQLERDLETEVRGSIDAAGIAEARGVLDEKKPRPTPPVVNG